MRRTAGTLPALITKAASKQTYYTIRLLVNRGRTLNAYRAYAYFRWVDDRLDQGMMGLSERMAFVDRQVGLIDGCYRGECPYDDLCAEEQIVVDLIWENRELNSGLRTYITHMMAVMAFDAKRRGQLISEQELCQYQRDLSIAVTEAMHYFIGYSQPAAFCNGRYLAVTAAHITHMLRDARQDIADGYFNIPREYLESQDLESYKTGSLYVQGDAYREWVKARVEEARRSFKEGVSHLAREKCMRCRIAGYAYMARFVGILESIERERYQLRLEYPERQGLRAWLKTIRFIIAGIVRDKEIVQ
jgi:phytoene/squalene synthetase